MRDWLRHMIEALLDVGNLTRTEQAFVEDCLRRIDRNSTPTPSEQERLRKLFDDRV